MNDPLAITVQPASAVIYPGVATTLVITGGTGSYVVVSDNQAIVPIVSQATGHSLTIIANPVSADTSVNLSVRDTGTAPQKLVALTVRPGTIANAITITPSSAACTPAICTGEEALVTATISQAGIPLPARGVRFDVVSGDVRFITTPVNTSPEVLATTVLTTSDQLGQARVRLRVLPGAPNQTALIQITDPETLAFQRVAITVRQVPGPGNTAFFVIPDTVTFTGPFANTCANNPTASIVIFGGTPPYNVVATVPLSGGGIVTASGTPVTIRGNGSTCFTDIPVTITDATGRTIVATFSSQQGTGTAPPAAVTIVPGSAAITACGGSVNLAIQGGSTTLGAAFGVASSSSAVTVAVTGRTITATRVTSVAPAPPVPSASPVTISATDGTTTGTASITVPTTCP
ncbi:hypothetical protein [Usitatibacter rugosus]|uniref:hypothetical protein n=1 Tax=Usitatibacter rugosus TaxID=2732067 RepID=UPI00148A0509|nr:hypothetical protein [Usitatibacter rugosus]